MAADLSRICPAPAVKQHADVAIPVKIPHRCPWKVVDIRTAEVCYLLPTVKVVASQQSRIRQRRIIDASIYLASRPLLLIQQRDIDPVRRRTPGCVAIFMPSRSVTMHAC
jgi:hypothetical protein